MDTLTPDPIKEILLLLSYEEIKTSCQTTAAFREVCQDDDLWRQLLVRDFSFDDPDEEGRTYLSPSIAGEIGLGNQMSNRETYHKIDAWIHEVIDILDFAIIPDEEAYQVLKEILLGAAEIRIVYPDDLWGMAAKFNYLKPGSVADLSDEIGEVTNAIEEAFNLLSTIEIYDESSEIYDESA